MLWKWHCLMWNRNASLVWGSMLDEVALGKSKHLASFTDSICDRMLYKRHMNLSTAFNVSSVTGPSPSPSNRSLFFWKTFHAVFFECPLMKDVVSQPVSAWNGISLDADPSGRVLITLCIGICFLFFDVPAIIQRNSHVILALCARSRIRTSVSRAHTTTACVSLWTLCNTIRVSASSWLAISDDTSTQLSEHSRLFQ